MRREIERAAIPESLQAIRDFIESSCREAQVEKAAAHGLVVAVDEACNNIVEHGYAGRKPGPIGVSFEAEGERLVVAITDRGRAFDPKSAPAPDLHSDWKDRRVGGLGWHLIRQFVDEIRYDPDAENGNRLTLVKRVGRARSKEMEILTEQRGRVTVISIVGSVDGMTAATLTGSFRAQVSGGNIQIVGDFARVEYTSSAGLRALLETVKETRQQGGDLRLAGVQPDVLRVLELSGFTHILKLFPDIESAVASFPA